MSEQPFDSSFVLYACFDHYWKLFMWISEAYSIGWGDSLHYDNANAPRCTDCTRIVILNEAQDLLLMIGKAWDSKPHFMKLRVLRFILLSDIFVFVPDIADHHRVFDGGMRPGKGSSERLSEMETVSLSSPMLGTGVAGDALEKPSSSESGLGPDNVFTTFNHFSAEAVPNMRSALMQCKCVGLGPVILAGFCMYQVCLNVLSKCIQQQDEVAGRVPDADASRKFYKEESQRPNREGSRTCWTLQGLPMKHMNCLGKMEVNCYLPNSCSYNVMIQGFLQNDSVSTAAKILDEMVSKGFAADISTATMFMKMKLLCSETTGELIHEIV
ncbi:hypothetical protein PTKIN_Ptkin16aG0027600 [Pterospermum kingtungense]